MFGLFGKKPREPAVVIATLNARLQPMHRADVEDAFDAAMQARRYGARVVGGGTLMGENGEVSKCDIEIELDDPSQKMIDLTVGVLEAIVAPKGSFMRIPHEDRRIEFGTLEGLALYLNGTDLPDDVYETCDSNHVYEQCDRLLAGRKHGVGEIVSHWHGPRESALYMYGPSFAAMLERIAPFLRDYPLCGKSRTEQIA
jgi:hypothetical protein